MRPKDTVIGVTAVPVLNAAMIRDLLTEQAVSEIIGEPFESTRHRCHQVSLAIVRSGAIPGSRVARGMCDGVASQHSWVVVGDCYAPRAPIVDATLWSYDDAINGVWHGDTANGRHRAHGSQGTIWTYGRPAPPTEEPITLTPQETLSARAREFLQMVGPLDRVGWSVLARSPVAGWPAGEILAAMDDTLAVRALVPIDRLGMLTDRNPAGLYLSASEGDTTRLASR